MAKYRKVDNCGRVPYPDRSGRFLNAGEEVEGDDWEPLVALGFVQRVEGSKTIETVTTVTSAAVTPKASPPPPPPPPPKVEEPKAEEPKADTLKEETQGVTDDMQQANDGTGAEEVDSSAAGKSGDEGVSGRPANRRRR